MKTTIDSAGRLVIPKNLRREAGLEAGTELRIRLRHGRIEVEPAPLPIKVVRKGRLTVAVPLREIPKLGIAQVEETRRRIRQERVDASGRGRSR